MDVSVDELARLARVKLSDEEKKKFQKELDGILEMFSELEDAPLREDDGEVPLKQGVSPTEMPETQTLSQDDSLGSAADTEDDLMRGPPVR